jgi:hypothetical protein
MRFRSAAANLRLLLLTCCCSFLRALTCPPLYLQPTITDLPGVVCSSQACAAQHQQQYKKGLGGILSERQASAAPFYAAGAALLGVAAVIVASVV